MLKSVALSILTISFFTVSAQAYSECKVGLSGTELMQMSDGMVGYGMSYKFGGSLGARITPKNCADVVEGLQKVISSAFDGQKSITLEQNPNSPDLVKEDGSVDRGDVVFGNSKTVHCEIQLDIQEEFVAMHDDGSIGSGMSYSIGGTVPPRLTKNQCTQLSNDLAGVLNTKMKGARGIKFRHSGHAIIVEQSNLVPTDSPLLNNVAQ